MPCLLQVSRCNEWEEGIFALPTPSHGRQEVQNQFFHSHAHRASTPAHLPQGQFCLVSQARYRPFSQSAATGKGQGQLSLALQPVRVGAKSLQPIILALAGNRTHEHKQTVALAKSLAQK